MRDTVLLAGVLVLVGAGCASNRDTFRPPVPPPETTRAEITRGEAPLDFAKGAAAPRVAADQVGLASWYGGAFAGRKTSSGERFDPNLLTAAHRTLPLGTWVEVRRVDSGAAIRVRINDRGPYRDARRVIDLSRKAAERLDLVRDGLVRVELRVVSGP